MNTALTLSFVLALLSVNNCSVDSTNSSPKSETNFCTAFKAHDWQISYTFRREYNKREWEPYFYDIIIDGHYWRLQYDIGDKILTFVDPKNMSKPCPLFSDEFSVAVCVKYESPFCDAVLFNKTDWRKWVWANLTNDNPNVDKDLKDYNRADTSTIGSFIEANPFTAFHQLFNPNKTMVVLVERSKSSSMVYRPWVLDITSGKSVQHLESDVTVNALTEYKLSYGLIGIFHQIHIKTEFPELLYILKDNYRIRYIECRADQNLPDCSDNKTKILIDCTPSGQPIPTKASNKNNWILIAIIGGTLVIVIIIVIIVVVSQIKRKKKEKKKTSETKKKSSPKVGPKVGPKVRTTTTTTTSGTGPTSTMKKATTSPKK